jgi:CHAD domain-containing protein
VAYRLERDDRSLQAALRRIAGEQFDRATDSIDRDEQSEAIHEVRRHCKRLRGLIRLVRTGFANFEAEDEAIRDIAKPLSGPRDARVMLDTFDRLVEGCEDKSERRRLAKVRERLDEERKELLHEVDAGELLGKACKMLAEARKRSAKWALSGDGWEVAGQGVAITYEKARATAAEAFAGRQPDVFHDLRKHIRYHWCHTRLLRGFWPEEMGARAALADELADILGEQHDVWVFVERLNEHPCRFGSGKQVDALLALASHRSTALEATAETLTGRLLAETTEALSEHWRALWSNWREGELPLSPSP